MQLQGFFKLWRYGNSPTHLYRVTRIPAQTRYDDWKVTDLNRIWTHDPRIHQSRPFKPSPLFKPLSHHIWSYRGTQQYKGALLLICRKRALSQIPGLPAMYGENAALMEAMGYSSAPSTSTPTQSHTTQLQQQQQQNLVTTIHHYCAPCKKKKNSCSPHPFICNHVNFSLIRTLEPLTENSCHMITRLVIQG